MDAPFTVTAHLNSEWAHPERGPRGKWTREVWPQAPSQAAQAFLTGRSQGCPAPTPVPIPTVVRASGFCSPCASSVSRRMNYFLHC